VDLRGGQQRQAPRTPPRRSRRLGRPHSFSEINRRTHRKVFTPRDVRINLGFDDDRIQLRL
jgi:hypothetical protein